MKIKPHSNLRVNAKKFTFLFLLILLISSTATGLFNIASVHAVGESTSLIGNLESVVSAVNYTNDIDAVYQGMMVGQTSMQQLINAYNALADPTSILQWTPILAKLGYANQTTIEWALDNQQMMSDGLPNTGADSLSGSTEAFLVYNRFLILAYGYAIQYNYDLTKWNLTQAYTSFKASVESATYPALLWVDQNGNAVSISYGPRYYDECGETIDVFLDFYNLGITSALNDAMTTWLWANNNLWSVNHYNYALGWAGYECEAPGFYQIALKLLNVDSSLPDTQNLLEDLENRFLQEQWLSPQWTPTLGGPTSYVVVHMASGNSQLRLENTVMAWAAIFGSYGELNSTYQSDVQNMLAGTTPAWYELLQSPLCGSYFPDFLQHSDDSAPGNDATATGADLLFMLGIVPETASLAIPIEENSYQYIYNILDPGLYNINTVTHTVTVSLASPGTLNFQFNSTVTGAFDQAGVYSVQFSSNWNAIVSITFAAPLPTNRQYMYTNSAAPTLSKNYMVVRGENDQIYYSGYNSTANSWNSWLSLPSGTTNDSPAAVTINDKLYIVVRGTNNDQIWFGSVNTTDDAFSGWTLLDGATPSAPTLTANSTTLCLVVRGESNNIFYRFYNITSQSWTAWTAVPVGSTVDSPAATMLSNQLHVVVRGANNDQIWYSNINLTTSTFSGWTLLDGATPSAPTLTANSTTLALVVRGENNQIYYRFYTIATQIWRSWTAIPVGSTIDSPAATITGNSLQIAVRGISSDQIWYSNINLTTSAFSGWTLIDGSTPSKPVLTS